MRPSSIVAATVACIAALGVLAFWDGARESSASLDDFGLEQATLARAVAASVRSTARAEHIAAYAGMRLPNVPGAFEATERAGEVVVVTRDALHDGVHTSTGAKVLVPRLEDAIDDSACDIDDGHAGGLSCSLRLTHHESVLLGLPPRMGMAGIATFRAEGDRAYAIAVIATAARERDRERRAAARVVLSFLVSSGLVLAFGTLALRKQRSELALAGELAIDAAVRARDERLVRADKLATMGALATGIAHEVSTPLGVIVGRAEQLGPKVAGDEKATRAVSAILEQSGRIEEIIRAFLTLARGGTPSLERTEPRALARAAVESVLHRFAHAEVELVTLARDADLPEVACERRLMEQALVNLLLNACDACTKGGTVTVDARLEAGQVAFVVTDDGAGITKEAAARAMEPFFTTKAEGEGTGLGLAITREIVHHHRGTLSVAARVGMRGTEARIILPPATAETS